MSMAWPPPDAQREGRSASDHAPAPALQRLAALRERELGQCQADLARQVVETERQRGQQARLEQLWRSSTTSGSASPQASLNCAHYKQTVLELASQQRDQLSRHEQAIELARQAVLLATRRHSALGQLLAQRQLLLDQARRVAEQKRQDELARQSWQRGAP